MSHDSKMIHPSPTAKLIPGYLTLFEYAGYHVAMVIIWSIAPNMFIQSINVGDKDEVYN